MGSNPNQREPANLIDGDTATKWLDENLRDASWLGRTTDPPAWAIHSILRFELAQPTQVSATPTPTPTPHPHPHPLTFTLTLTLTLLLPLSRSACG